LPNNWGRNSKEATWGQKKKKHLDEGKRKFLLMPADTDG